MQKDDRSRLYEPLIAQHFGAKRIAKATGIPLGTVKRDLTRMRRSAIEISPSASPGVSPPVSPAAIVPQQSGTLSEMQPIPPCKDFDREKAEDELAEIASRRAKRCKDPLMTMDWMKVYAYLQQVKASRDRNGPGNGGHKKYEIVFVDVKPDGSSDGSTVSDPESVHNAN